MSSLDSNSPPAQVIRKGARPIPQIQAYHGATHVKTHGERTTDESLDFIADQSTIDPAESWWEVPKWKDKVSTTEGSCLAVISLYAHCGFDLTMLTFFSKFISARGNEYFCDIDEDYLTDRFNLTGLNTEVQYYQHALDLVTDVFDFECEDEMRDQIEKSARHLYGLIHARFITTTRGLAKMVRSNQSINIIER